MAEQLKNIFNEETITLIAGQLGAALKELDVEGFQRRCLQGLEPLSLTERAAHIATIMESVLPKDGEEALRVLIASFGPELAGADSIGFSSLRYMSHALVISRLGLPHFALAMQAQQELTKRFTAEFSIRSFLLQYPKETHAQMLVWAKDGNVHVRRLASEGTRPRLPWAAYLEEYQRDPAPIFEILELLKDDPERYVQRSVANNLNDIAKDNPALVIALCERWSTDATEGRRWIIGHALRSLIKKGDRAALSLVGTGSAPEVEVREITLSPQQLKLGQKASLSFVIKGLGEQPQALMIDYAVHYVKANGKTNAKVFKLKKASLAKGASLPCTVTISFAEFTTRKHYPGVHRVEALINGGVFPLGEFSVIR
jgi:3-methyladenine DNA glycosylase AlkC